MTNIARVDSSELRHDVSNLLSVALANVEGMIDGLVPPTASRLEAIADALRSAGKLLQQERESAQEP